MSQRSVEKEMNGGVASRIPDYGGVSDGSSGVTRTSVTSANAAYEGPVGNKPALVKWPTSRKKAAFVIIMLTLLNATNKLDRYVLIEVIEDMAHDIQFGDRNCLNSSITSSVHVESVDEMKQYTCSPERCDHTELGFNETEANLTSCHWVYWGTGLEYQLLAGPAFIVVVGLTRIPLTWVMEKGRINSRNVVVLCAIAWSMATLMTGFATEVWHVAVCRILLGLFQAPFSPFSVALVTAYFPTPLRGLALSILNSGIAIGYALAYGLGFVREMAGWRWAYWTASSSGVIVAVIMLFTVNNPTELVKRQTSKSMGKMRRRELLVFLNWMTIIPLSLGSALRFGSTYIFNYNINNYLLHYYPHFPVHNYLSWTPILSGIGGIFFGGLLSDAAWRNYGLEGRLCIQIALSVIAGPIITLVFFLDPPEVFGASTIGTSVADAWTGVTVSSLSELIPASLRPTFFAFYYCLINTVGGTLNIMLPGLRHVLGFRYAMVMAVVGLISVGTTLFALGFFALLCSRRRYKKDTNDNEDDDNDTDNEHVVLLQ
ncbi:probable sulfoacetate transporter SauU [Diadema antillarum]|uniref:probable sulfoacetate transporter SauU n=1 Tax=Diadema antillarum TaxID=105358 RepID=UPI003A8A0E49